MKPRNGKTPLMQLRFSLPKSIVFSTLIMTVLILFVYFCNIPNPNMILIAGLVLCSALFSFGGGVTAGIIMLFYTLFFFSTDNSFIHFTSQNLQKVFVSFVGIIADMLLVCFLKRSEVQAFTEVKSLTEKLHDENERLQEISLIDALTGVQNRMALRKEYDSYRECEVTVLMLDIDKFKMINDNYGHIAGDRVLKETGALLSSVFGKSNCFRYGGDEFLVICPETSEKDFRIKLDEMMKNKPKTEVDGKSVAIDYSVGIASGTLKEADSLRRLFYLADERMYDDKHRKIYF